jgi:uncharacterized protein
MTPSKDTVIACLQQNFAHLKEQYHIKKIGLFGSFATETATETSDVDLVVEFEQPIGLKFVDLCEDLEACLGRKVDVLTATGVANIRNRSVADSITKSLIYV